MEAGRNSGNIDDVRFRGWKIWKKLKQLKLFNLQIPRVDITAIFKHMTDIVLGGISKVTVVVPDF